MIDTTLLKKNEDYNELVTTYVIFFTEKDIFGDGRPLRHYVMRDIESNDLFGDERHIMFWQNVYAILKKKEEEVSAICAKYRKI